MNHPSTDSNKSSPGQGYRWLTSHEKTRKGDQFMASGLWINCSLLGVQPVAKLPVRRKIS
jgi:hypothetical protein